MQSCLWGHPPFLGVTGLWSILIRSIFGTIFTFFFCLVTDRSDFKSNVIMGHMRSPGVIWGHSMSILLRNFYNFSDLSLKEKIWPQMTSDDPGWPNMTKNDIWVKIGPISHESKEKCENRTENTPYQYTSKACNSLKTGVSPKTTLQKNDPWSLLYNFHIGTYPIRGCPRKFLNRFVKKVPVLELRATKNCLWSWSKHIDMNSQNESLDELVHLKGKKSWKISSKRSSFSSLLT